MDANKILQSDILDILFDGRNKEYGAYKLRKTYSKRLFTALAAMIGIFSFLYGSAYFAGKFSKPTESKQVFVQDLTLDDVKTKDETKIAPPPPPPPPPRVEPPRVEIARFTPPEIRPDNEVTDPPIAQDDLDGKKIGKINQAGTTDDNIIQGPPPEPSLTIAKPPAPPAEDYEKEVKIVQLQAKFPGGDAAWRKYLERNLNNSLPVDNGAPAGRYTVVVSFLVDKTGTISEVRAENDPGYGTAEEAVRVIRRSETWTPAEQNGRKVIYRQRQQIVFEVQE